MYGEYPIKGWYIHQVPHIELFDPDFRGGNTFSFVGSTKSNVDGQNPAAQAAFKTGATIEQLLKLYNDSGSSMPFGQWVQQDTVKAQIKTLISQGADAANGTNNGGLPPAPDADANAKEAEILGMHPITFGLVAVGSLAFLIFGLPKIIKAVKNNTSASAVTPLA